MYSRFATLSCFLCLFQSLLFSFLLRPISLLQSLSFFARRPAFRHIKWESLTVHKKTRLELHGRAGPICTLKVNLHFKPQRFRAKIEFYKYNDQRKRIGNGSVRTHRKVDAGYISNWITVGIPSGQFLTPGTIPYILSIQWLLSDDLV